MRPREFLWRIQGAGRLPADWVKYRMGVAQPPADVAKIPRPYPIDAHSCGAPADRFRIFDIDFPIGFEFDWHRDYRTGKDVARTFAPTLNIRDTGAVGDIKYIWEVNRHQHLSALACSDDSEQGTRYILRSLDRWIRDNPYLCGVNWTSGLELGLRVISWSVLYPRVAGELARDTDLTQRWLGSLYLHLHRIHERRSAGSSANNHLIGELVGLYIGATCFPLWPECRGWAAEARRSLEREIQIQISEDGVNREQAMAYHLFTLELLLLAYTVAKKRGEPFSQNHERRLRAMLHYLNAVATPQGDLPWYGDSDDARGFLFSTAQNALAVTRQLGAALLGDESGTELFKDGGMAAIKTQDGSGKLVMDFGPLGYTSIAAHGHADALSIWLAIGGEYFLGDCGTYAYHSDAAWRTFFRGTAAHNTVRIDGQDQSVMGGRFLWTGKANSRLLRFEETNKSVFIEAEHDGYLRLKDPVMHRRSVKFDRRTGSLEISDRFECQDRHEVELFFHLHEDTRIGRIETGLAETTWRGRNIAFSSPDAGLKWQVVHGSETPILGWRSRSFNRKQPIPSLRIAGSVLGATTVRTNIEIEEST